MITNHRKTRNESANKPSGSLKRLLIVLVVVIVLGSGYVAWQKYGITTPNPVLPTTTSKSTTPTSTTSALNSSTIPSTSASVPADWKTYTNTKYGFTIKYPKPWDYNTQLESGKVVGDLDGDFVTFGTRADLQAPLSLNTIKVSVGDNSYYIAHPLEAPSPNISVGPDRIPAVKKIPGSETTVGYKIYRGNYIFTIVGGNNLDLDMMVSTFQFTQK